jgi:hypothetical protein
VVRSLASARAPRDGWCSSSAPAHTVPRLLSGLVLNRSSRDHPDCSHSRATSRGAALDDELIGWPGRRSAASRFRGRRGC